MSGELVDDPMEITGAAYDMDVGDPSVEGTDSQQIEEMIVFEERNVAPLPDQAQSISLSELRLKSGFIKRASDLHSSRKERGQDIDEPDDNYELVVESPAVCIDYLSCSYTSFAFFKRVDFVIKHCPTLRQEALIVLIQHLREETRNVARYSSAFKDLEEQIQLDSGLKSHLTKPFYDSKWVEDTGAVCLTQLDHLQGEYKRQKDEGVKESTRRSMEDLFQHFCSVGQIDDALRLYGRGIRDYCSQLKHSINMWINWIELSIYANEWSKVESLSNQAMRTLKDAEDAEKSNNAPRNDHAITFMLERESTVQANTVQNNRALIDSALAKVMAVQALNRLRQKKYKLAVEKILEIKLDNLQPQWFVTQSDLGIYSLLASMTFYSRNELKKKANEEGSFRKMLESEPQFFELLQVYTSSQFGRCFELMNVLQDRLLLDPFISKCVNDLYKKIRQKCVVQYLAPYSAIRIATMSEELGFTATEIEKVVIDLIESKEVDIRIDQVAGILRVVNKADLDATKQRVVEVCKKTIYKSNIILWKSMLTQAGIVVTFEKEMRGKRKTIKHYDITKESRSSNQEVRGTATIVQHTDEQSREEDAGNTEAADLAVEEPIT